MRSAPTGTTEQRKQALIAAFRAFDREGTGKVSTEGLMTILRGVGNRLSAEEAKEIALDADSNGFIEYERYVNEVVFSV
jgi:Ca2+-binding EF-hand superfamily protein